MVKKHNRNNLGVNQGLKIKGLMAENNHNLSDLAKVLKVHRNTLSMKIRNKRPFTALEIQTIADYYNVGVNIFFN